MRKRLFRFSNGRARLFVGLFIAGLFCVQCTRTTQATLDCPLVAVVSGTSIGGNCPDVLKQIDDLARTDQIALLELCLKNYDSAYRDYKCTFVKQERLCGKLGPAQVINAKFKEGPFSVALEWIENKPIADKVIFVEGKHGNQMLAKPRGMLGSLVGTVLRQPDGQEAMKNTLRPVNLFGFRRAIENLLEIYRKASKLGDLKEDFGGYAEVSGRKTVVMVRHLPAKLDYPAEKTLVYVDLDYMVPICVEAYDWQGQLSSRYVYKDITFNIGLTDDEFTPEANGMPPIK